MAAASQFTAAERFESLKTAAISGMCAGVFSFGLLVCHRFLAQSMAVSLSGLIAGLAELTLWVNVAIAVLSGALFGLTYRYAVRQDKNPQLNAGVVLAFTLVRGLAQVDAGSAIAQRAWPFLAACSESFVMFALTALCLTLAIQRQWIAPFGQRSSES